MLNEQGVLALLYVDAVRVSELGERKSSSQPARDELESARDERGNLTSKRACEFPAHFRLIYGHGLSSALFRRRSPT